MQVLVITIMKECYFIISNVNSYVVIIRVSLTIELLNGRNGIIRTIKRLVHVRVAHTRTITYVIDFIHVSTMYNSLTISTRYSTVVLYRPYTIRSRTWYNNLSSLKYILKFFWSESLCCTC